MALALHTYRFKLNGTYIWMFGDEVWQKFKLQPKSTELMLENYFNNLSFVYGIYL